MKPLAEALKHAVNIYQFPEASEVIACSNSGSTRRSPARSRHRAALNGMADEIHARHGQVRLQDRQAGAAEC